MMKSTLSVRGCKSHVRVACTWYKFGRHSNVVGMFSTTKWRYWTNLVRQNPGRGDGFRDDRHATLKVPADDHLPKSIVSIEYPCNTLSICARRSPVARCRAKIHACFRLLVLGYWFSSLLKNDCHGSTCVFRFGRNCCPNLQYCFFAATTRPLRQWCMHHV